MTQSQFQLHLQHHPDVKHVLINAREKEGKAYDELQKTHLEENAYKDFYEKQHKLQLKTFSDLKKIQTRQKILENDVILKADKRLFGNGCNQKLSEYDQEIPQSHTADQPMAP